MYNIAFILLFLIINILIGINIIANKNNIIKYTIFWLDMFINKASKQKNNKGLIKPTTPLYIIDKIDNIIFFIFSL